MSWKYPDPIMVKWLRNETVEFEIRQCNVDKVVRLFIKQVNEKYGTHYLLLVDDDPHEDDEQVIKMEDYAKLSYEEKLLLEDIIKQRNKERSVKNDKFISYIFDKFTMCVTLVIFMLSVAYNIYVFSNAYFKIPNGFLANLLLVNFMLFSFLSYMFYMIVIKTQKQMEDESNGKI